MHSPLTSSPHNRRLNLPHSHTRHHRPHQRCNTVLLYVATTWTGYFPSPATHADCQTGWGKCFMGIVLMIIDWCNDTSGHGQYCSYHMWKEWVWGWCWYLYWQKYHSADWRKTWGSVALWPTGARCASLLSAAPLAVRPTKSWFLELVYENGLYFHAQKYIALVVVRAQRKFF